MDDNWVDLDTAKMLNRRWSRKLFRSTRASGETRAPEPSSCSSSPTKSTVLNSWSAVMICEAAGAAMKAGGGVVSGGGARVVLRGNWESLEKLVLRERDMDPMSKGSEPLLGGIVWHLLATSSRRRRNRVRQKSSVCDSCYIGNLRIDTSSSKQTPFRNARSF